MFCLRLKGYCGDRLLIGYWYHTVISISVCPSVTLCIVAKRYMLERKFVNKRTSEYRMYPPMNSSTPPALVKGSRAPSVRSHGTCTMFLGYPCTPCTLHCRLANPWSGVQLVEVRPYAEEEEEEEHVCSIFNGS